MNLFEIKKTVFYPNSAPHSFWNKGVYMPISANNNRVKDKDSLGKIMKYLLRNCDKFSAIIGDYLHRHNLQLTHGISADEAKNASYQLGETLKHAISVTAMNIGVQDKINIISSKLYYERGDFSPRLTKLFSIYWKNKLFQSITETTIDSFLIRNKIHPSISRDKARELCRNYLLEEIIIFEMLAEDGLTVNVYPGKQLPVMKEIVTGNLFGVSEKLEKIQLVEIKFKIHKL